MQSQDIFFGAITAALGIAMMVGASLGGRWLLERRGARSLVAAIGRPAARIVLGLLGLALIALGIAVALGWRLNWL
jgi:ABC-type tungstate transport system substrate-binding protein